jgi:hypothetical protein
MSEPSLNLKSPTRNFPGIALATKGAHPFVLAERSELRTPPLSSDVLKMIDGYLERQSQN